MARALITGVSVIEDDELPGGGTLAATALPLGAGDDVIELKPDAYEPYGALAQIYNSQQKFDLANEMSAKATASVNFMLAPRLTFDSRRPRRGARSWPILPRGHVAASDRELSVAAGHHPARAFARGRRAVG